MKFKKTTTYFYALQVRYCSIKLKRRKQKIFVRQYLMESGWDYVNLQFFPTSFEYVNSASIWFICNKVALLENFVFFVFYITVYVTLVLNIVNNIFHQFNIVTALLLLQPAWLFVWFFPCFVVHQVPARHGSLVLLGLPRHLPPECFQKNCLWGFRSVLILLCQPQPPSVLLMSTSEAVRVAINWIDNFSCVTSLFIDLS